MAGKGTKTSAFTARSTSDAPLSGFPRVGCRGSEALLDCLSVLEGADSLFLRRRTGLAAGELSSHLRGLAERGYVAPIPAGSEGFGPLLRLTDEGRDAYQTVKRWRFKSAALVLLSALSRR